MKRTKYPQCGTHTFVTVDVCGCDAPNNLVPEAARPKPDSVPCSEWVAELEAELVRVKAMREDAERRGELEYARYDFGVESGLRFALDSERRRSATGAHERDDEAKPRTETN
jgi:hypothetical protein